MGRLNRYFIALALLLYACGYQNSPEGVGNEFLFRYFIELNQRGALEIANGLAKDKLQKEIELTQNIRMTPNLDLAQHKPFIDYELVNVSQRQDKSVTLFYNITIETVDGSNTQREVVLTTAMKNNAWLVTNFDTFLKN